MDEIAVTLSSGCVNFKNKRYEWASTIESVLVDIERFKTPKGLQVNANTQAILKAFEQSIQYIAESIQKEETRGQEEIFSPLNTIIALKQWLDYGEKTHAPDKKYGDLGHNGAFCGDGYQARCLRALIKKLESHNDLDDPPTFMELGKPTGKG